MCREQELRPDEQGAGILRLTGNNAEDHLLSGRIDQEVRAFGGGADQYHILTVRQTWQVKGAILTDLSLDQRTQIEDVEAALGVVTVEISRKYGQGSPAGQFGDPASVINNAV